MREQAHRLVFIDETATTTKMTRLRGRARNGQRLKARAPFGDGRPRPSSPACAIEMAFSKLKVHLRRIGARTIEDFWKALGSICDPEKCRRYFAAAGYASDETLPDQTSLAERDGRSSHRVIAVRIDGAPPPSAVWPPPGHRVELPDRPKERSAGEGGIKAD